ncbi:MAG TPA: DUF3299 domain-containing protein [Tepidisphaeraceae bacterium]|nr:DUF3299 domain-containing protein [Tepidisphaeraceae bacterium]
MTTRITSFFAAFLIMGSLTLTAPFSRAVDETPPSTAQLEVRATTAFNRGEYNTALPILKKLSDAFKDDPKKLGSIQEKIRVCERGLAAAKAAAATQPATPVAINSAEARKPHPRPRPGEVLEMPIKELGNFEYDQEHGGNIPADVKALNGAKIRLRGFMIPMDQAENITQFALVPSLFACCFGQPPQIQHTIVANCPKGKAVGYCPDEIIVEGTLKVEEKKDDGYIISIFELGVSSVKPAPK